MTLHALGKQERASGNSALRAVLQTFLALVLSAGLTAVAQAQTQTGRVTGIVVDSLSRAPLAGVQVYLEGSTLGAMTRNDGRYVITNVPPGRFQLRAERIGMTLALREITMTAGGTIEANFALEMKALGLDEIVVTGTAGAARRREVGNSISAINVANLPDKPVEVTKMLQAAAPGIDVTNGGAGAGQGAKIRLRGVKSVAMSSDPIIYIDGIRMMSGGFEVLPARDQGNRAANVTQSPLDMINPNDIERIEVIKGSAATTLYGTEASAGVIQIFTKKGSSGAPVWTFETQQGTQWSQRFGMADNTITYPSGEKGTSKYVYMDPWICTGFLKCGTYMKQLPITNSNPAAFRDAGGPAWTQLYSASVRGGGQQLQYFTSAELFDERGNTPADNIQKWAARGNFTYSPINNLQLQWNAAYMNQAQTNSAQGNNAEGLELNVFRQNGNYFSNRADSLINRVFDQTLSAEIERFTTGGTATYSPMTNLTNRFTIGYDFSNQDTRNLRPFSFFAHPEGILSTHNFERRLLTFDYVGSYAFDLMESLRANFSWGGQAVGDESRRLEGDCRDFPGAVEPTCNSASVKLAYETRSKIWNAGFFLQNIFDIRNKYFLTLGMRVDGNSAFGSGFGLQFYPKASASWVLSDESFWRESWGQIKLRSAYGKAGRAPGAFDAVRTWTNTGLAGQPAFAPSNVGNPDLGPEVTGEFEAGFDASWLSDRVRATYTYYRQLTEDALLNVNQIPSQGFTNSQLQNVGEIKNWGNELSLEVTPIRRSNFGWDVGVNFTTNKSEVLSYPDRPQDVGRPVQYSLHNIIRNPQAIPTHRVDSLGVATYTLRNCQDTIPTISSFTPAGEPCVQRNVFRGSDLPTHTVSGFTTLRLPYGVSVSARGEYRGGHYFTGFSAGPIAVGRGVRSPACFDHYRYNDATTTSTALEAGVPALWVARCTSSPATGYSQKADYFKVRSLSITIPTDFAFPDRVQNSTLTLAFGNLYTWSRSMFGTYGIETFGNAGIASEGASIGIATNERIPPTTTFRASLRVTF
jgi:TonB-dependent starch-binding outer membrane protein SusC